MNYSHTVKARFLDRPNRFVAHVELVGQTETVHVKNTGRYDQRVQGGPVDQYGFPGAQ